MIEQRVRGYTDQGFFPRKVLIYVTTSVLSTSHDVTQPCPLDFYPSRYTVTLPVLHEAPLQDLLLSQIDVVLHMPYKHNTLLREW